MVVISYRNFYMNCIYIYIYILYLFKNITKGAGDTCTDFKVVALSNVYLGMIFKYILSTGPVIIRLEFCARSVINPTEKVNNTLDSSFYLNK